jgi:hypothetical protein
MRLNESNHIVLVAIPRAVSHSSDTKCKQYWRALCNVNGAESSKKGRIIFAEETGSGTCFWLK